MGLCITWILSSICCCSMSWKTALFFNIYVAFTVCRWLLRAHILTSRHAHHHYHMFKQQVPYVALPLALGEPRDHILLSHTHHHPGLTDHSQADGPWWLLGLCLRPVCLKFDETQSQQKLLWIIQSLTAVEPLFSLPSCLREPRSGSL